MSQHGAAIDENEAAEARSPTQRHAGIHIDAGPQSGARGDNGGWINQRGKLGKTKGLQLLQEGRPDQRQVRKQRLAIDAGALDPKHSGDRPLAPCPRELVQHAKAFR